MMATKAKKRPKGRTRKPKQPFLSEEMAPESIPAIDAAADHYFDTMTERAALSKTEHEAMENLVEKMKEHAVDRYETRDGLVVTAVSKTKCLVKRKKDAEPSSNGEAEE